MISLTIIKIVISIMIVMVLAEISKRLNPQMAGMIAGIPLGSGLSMYFITLEQGIDFAIIGIPWGIAGLAGSLLFCFVYLLISRSHMFHRTIATVLFAAMAAILAFLILGFLLFLLEINILWASFIFIVVFTGNLIMMNKLVPKQGKIEVSKSTFMHYVIRGLAVGVFLIIITGISSLVGSKWANILSAFPSTMLPLLVVLHLEQGNRLFPYVIYGFSYSITTLYVFYLSYLYLVPAFGLNLGYVIIYGICVVSLFVFHKAREMLSRVKTERNN